MQYRCAKFIATRYLQSAGECNVRMHRVLSRLAGVAAESGEAR